ncbi:MAG TPA: TetR/AcrR family transcriptional regulator [Streptosporangiaceae bacterium]|nr:TetR/AcrR family transcriptional regulator [Streptosporangiaceae bacterium]
MIDDAGQGIRNAADQAEPTARPGRKRSQETRRAILAAALELTAEAGYARLTIDGIAARSGAGKQTIYRWWPSKNDVLLEALAAKADLHVPVTDEGSFRADLRAFLLASFAMGRQPQLIDLLRALMARAQIDEAFGERFRAAFLQRRRDALAVILDRALERGDLPQGASPGTVSDLVFGLFWYRMLATRQPPDEHLADELVSVLAGPAPHS